MKLCDFESDYEIPNNWVWCNLGLLFNHNTGKALNSASSEGKALTYITTSNVYWNRFELNDLKSMPFTDSEIEKCTIKKGDLLVCEGGDIGRAAIWNFDNEIRIQNHLHRLRAYDYIQTAFYYYVLYAFKLSGKISGNGIGLQGLSSNALHNIIVPVPPIEEQKNIVMSIEKLMLSIDNIESHKNILAICIENTKAKILELAIRGKLVPQDPNDEPASVLLEHIRAEKEELIRQGKIKRDKKESVIFKGDDNSYYRLTADNKSNIIDIPFDISDNWVWCNLSMIGSTNIGLTYKPTDIVTNGTMVLRSSNIINGKIDLTDLVRVNSTIRENQYIQENDILICARNGSKALVGKCAIYENANEKASFGAFMAVYRSRFFRYVYYFLNSEFFRNTFSNDDSKQINQLTQDMIKNTTIPLPPFTEQKRIVDAIETAFLQLDEIANDIS